MNPDDLKQAWRTQTSQARLSIDADLLLNEVQRNQQSFVATIFWRDFREVAVALLMIPLWFYLGARHSSPWTWYLTVPVLIWIAGFTLVYRLRHPQAPNKPDEPLLQCVRNSLAQVEDQIWLLRNVFWWYLLPPGISITAFFAHVTWLASDDWLEALGGGSILFGILLALYSFIYYLNQLAVRMHLEPRRRELSTLLASLGDEATSSEFAAVHDARSAQQPRIRRRSLLIAGLCVAAVAALSVAAHFFGQEGVYPKRAPYSAIRWEGDKPVVRIGDEWLELVSIDGIAAEDIVAFSRRTYGNLWQKRFEEDLVDVLSRMGHEPDDSVRLVVRSLGSSETRTLEDVPMTEANRRAIRAAAQARERRVEQSAM